MKPVYLVVNGILTDSDDINGWTDLFEDMYQNEGYACNRYEYTCGLFKSLFQGKRVEDLKVICKRIQKPLIYVGHSNGCDLFGKLMKDGEAKFEEAHLFAAAMDADCNHNGITYGLVSEKVKRVFIYCSKRDLVLRNWASKTTFLRYIGMGYGTLGSDGPKNVLKQVEDKITVVWNNRFGHSDWFKPKNIQESFQLTLNR